MKKNNVPRSDPEQKIASSVYDFSKNLPKETNKYKFLNHKVSDNFLKKILKLEKFYINKVLLKY